jgi:hypothetical protein
MNRRRKSAASKAIPAALKGNYEEESFWPLIQYVRRRLRLKAAKSAGVMANESVSMKKNQ